MKITRIPAKPPKIELLRVAAYARVSTGKEAMLHSLAAQTDYYGNLIMDHNGWRFAGIYADASKSTFMVTLFSPHVNIQRRGDTAQSRRRRCSIPAESVLNSAGFGALTERYIQVLNQRYQEADEKLSRLKAEREERLTRSKAIRRFLALLDDQPVSLDAWDEQAWNLLVSQVTIHEDGSAEFVFRGEITITVRAK